MHTPLSPAYRKAFNQYLRRGTPVSLSLKAAAEAHATPYYIWRTRADGKVRPSHAANNGKIFAWDNPPETGNPGEAYGCRCWAEAFAADTAEFAEQQLTTIVDEGLERWWAPDFLTWFYTGEGKVVTLSFIGHLNEMIAALEKKGVFKRVNSQIIDEVRKSGSGSIHYNFKRPYDVTSVSYPHGNATVSGNFYGNAIEKNGIYLISGTMTYLFSDLFTDPVRLRDQLFNGTSDPRAVSETWRDYSDFKGTPYPIIDVWETTVRISVKANKDESIF